jgi:hypothetical protein
MHKFSGSLHIENIIRMEEISGKLLYMDGMSRQTKIGR